MQLVNHIQVEGVAFHYCFRSSSIEVLSQKGCEDLFVEGWLVSTSFFNLHVPNIFQVQQWFGFAYRWRANSVVTINLSSCSYLLIVKLRAVSPKKRS